MILLAASLAIFVYGMVASMLGTIIPALAVRLSLTNVQVGYVALAQGIGLAAASTAAGVLIDKYSKKFGLLLGLTLILAGLLQLAHPFGLLSIMGANFVLGAGGSMVIVGGNALGSDVSTVRRASVLNFLNIFVGLGGLATPFVAGNLLGSDPTRVTLAACVITAVTFLVIAVAKIRPQVVIVKESAAARAPIFGNFLLYVLAAAIFLYTACEFGVWNWLPKYLIAQGVPSSEALTILSLGFALGLLCGRIVAAQVLTKLRPLTVSVSASVVMAITTYGMLHAPSPTMTAVVVFCAGLAMAPVFPTLLSIVGDLFPRGTSTAMGFVITCGFSGLVVSSPVIGWLSGSDPKGLQTGLLLLPALSICITVLLVVFRARLSTAGPEVAVAPVTP